ncbi:hypothetical protein K0F54_20090, partial [Bacteroides fragilis]|nr:hypothetical protein [Bacteroides fragilis]
YFFLFSFTKKGRIRSSVKDRYAISSEKILSALRGVRFFPMKFLACCPYVSWGLFKKKGKKWVRYAGGGGFRIA